MMDNKQQEQDEPLIHDFNQKNNSPLLSLGLIAFLIIVIGLGIGTGYFLSKHNIVPGGISMKGINLTNNNKIVGSNDLKTFNDTAEGVLKNGGIDGEGEYHLVRPGGNSQNVYLTSSIVDMSQFVGKKIKVWGQTQKAQHAGWLMDVGRVEILN